MNYFSNSEGHAMLDPVISAIQANREYLSRIDGEIGDGDHGVNMSKGFTIASERMDKDITFSDGTETIGMALMMEIGGSMGPIYGTFFNALAEKSADADRIDAALFGEMLAHATEEVLDICGAVPGDKTLVDTLVPANEAFGAALAESAGFTSALKQMVEKAREGRDATTGMVAKKGRSSRLGERSRGVLDAGAASCYLILEAMSEAIIAHLKD